MKVAITTRNAQADALDALLNNGYLRIYSGTEPTTPQDALSGNTLLAELRLNATWAPAASGGVKTLNAITQDSAADATGTATFWRMFSSDGTTVRAQGTVTATGGGGDLQLNTVSIVAAAIVQVTAFTWTIPQ